VSDSYYYRISAALAQPISVGVNMLKALNQHAQGRREYCHDALFLTWENIIRGGWIANNPNCFANGALPMNLCQRTWHTNLTPADLNIAPFAMLNFMKKNTKTHEYDQWQYSVILTAAFSSTSITKWDIKTIHRHFPSWIYLR
jgi:hypothetical protein